jgi:acyl-CoA thioester hydrolase
VTGGPSLKDSETRLRVIYADTDAMGIVYHGSYIKWFETGRTELMRSLNIPPHAADDDPCYFPVTKLSCHYLFPARYDDELIVQTELCELRRASIMFHYTVLNVADGKVLVRGSTLHACTDRRGRIIRIPPTVVSKIE